MKASLESQQRDEWRRLNSQIRRLDRPVRFTAHLRPTLDALNDPRFGENVLQFLMECGASAIAGGTRECHGCCHRWDRGRPLVAVGVFEFLSFKGGGLIGLCPECWGRPDRLQIAIDGFKRDFGLASVEAAPIGAGGCA